MAATSFILTMSSGVLQSTTYYNLLFYSSVGYPVRYHSGFLIWSGTNSLADIFPGLRGPVNLNLCFESSYSSCYLWYVL